jgi:hypothetical protein
LYFVVDDTFTVTVFPAVVVTAIDVGVLLATVPRTAEGVIVIAVAVKLPEESTVPCAEIRTPTTSAALETVAPPWVYVVDPVSVSVRVDPPTCVMVTDPSATDDTVPAAVGTKTWIVVIL